MRPPAAWFPPLVSRGRFAHARCWDQGRLHLLPLPVAPALPRLRRRVEPPAVPAAVLPLSAWLPPPMLVGLLAVAPLWGPGRSSSLLLTVAAAPARPPWHPRRRPLVPHFQRARHLQSQGPGPLRPPSPPAVGCPQAKGQLSLPDVLRCTRSTSHPGTCVARAFPRTGRVLRYYHRCLDHTDRLPRHGPVLLGAPAAWLPRAAPAHSGSALQPL
jgi:hypothetical protein